MLRRKANLAGITVIEVRGAYSTMIGNLAFEAPDACASAMEIARRGIAAGAKVKDLLPVFDEGWRDGLRKDLALPAEAEGWAEVHRAIKAAKIGVRRPHPRLASDPGGRLPGGIAVRRLGRRQRGRALPGQSALVKPSNSVRKNVGWLRIQHRNPDSRNEQIQAASPPTPPWTKTCVGDLPFGSWSRTSSMMIP
ncbi:hypothetical protein JQ594_00740 [Bradyrhizobium manausense]|nr:hypothetical protein [Bradyrhizobium manausense]